MLKATTSTKCCCCFLTEIVIINDKMSENYSCLTEGIYVSLFPSLSLFTIYSCHFPSLCNVLYSLYYSPGGPGFFWFFKSFTLLLFIWLRQHVCLNFLAQLSEEIIHIIMFSNNVFVVSRISCDVLMLHRLGEEQSQDSSCEDDEDSGRRWRGQRFQNSCVKVSVLVFKRESYCSTGPKNRRSCV